MGWEEQLFSVLDDLEQQAEAAYDAERDAELADRSRAEYASVTLAGRLMASVGRELSLSLVGGTRVTGELRRVGDGWCLLHGSGQDWVVAQRAVLRVAGASPRAVPPVAWSPLARLGLGSALRRVADTREPCVAHLDDGSHEVVELARIGGDFAETTSGVLLPFARLVAVQRREAG